MSTRFGREARMRWCYFGSRRFVRFWSRTGTRKASDHSCCHCPGGDPKLDPKHGSMTHAAMALEVIKSSREPECRSIS